MTYAYAVLNTDKNMFLSTMQGKQVFPSDNEAEETLVEENSDCPYDDIMNAEHLQVVQVKGVNGELFE